MRGGGQSVFIEVCGNTVEKKNKLKVLKTLKVSTGSGILNPGSAAGGYKEMSIFAGQ
jgi:hypothetical protein